METRLSKDKGKQLLEKCGFMEGWEVPREGLSGGLLLGRMSPYKLSIQYSSKYLIHANLLDNRGNPLSISFIYGHLIQSKRDIVWLDLKSISKIAHKNWLGILTKSSSKMRSLGLNLERLRVLNYSNKLYLIWSFVN